MTAKLRATEAHREETPGIPPTNDPVVSVSLVFPPLVDSSFGRYYPSTAVLAAFLNAKGFHAAQSDLNQRFALHLLEPAHLASLGRGEAPGREQLPLHEEIPVAARLLSRSRHLLFDEGGRFTSEGSSPDVLLRTVARLYHLDREVGELASAAFAEHAEAAFYEAFYDHSRYADELPTTVRLVGISVPMGPQLGPAIIFSRWLKRHRPDVRIVMGGPTLSLMALPDLDVLIRSVPELDAIVRYDGELPIEQLTRQAIHGDWQPWTVPAVTSIHEGRTVHVPPATGARLAELPFATYAPEIIGNLGNPTISVVQARGCYWGRCSYCDYVELYEGSASYRTRAPSSFVDEMAHQVQTLGTTSFYVVTESIPATFARRMSELILARGLDVRWSSFAMVDRHFTPEVFEIMARAGCSSLTIGMETMTDRVLRLVKKAATQELNIAFIQRAFEHGISLNINLIPDLPTTTRAEATETLRIMRSLSASIESLGIFPFEATRSSEIGRHPKRFGLNVIREGGGCGQAEFTSNSLVVRDDAMSPEDRKAVIAEYRAFADEIAARRTGPAKAFALESVVYIPDERVELTDVGARIHGYNWKTRSKFALKKAWSPVIAEVRERRRMRGVDLAQHFSSRERAHHALQHAVSLGLFEIETTA